MLALVQTLAWAGVTAYGIWRFAKVLELFAPAPVTVSPDGDDDIVVPDDLLAFAATLQDPWAIEDTIKVMRERYVDLRDWNRVRSAMGIGALPNQNNP